MKNQALFSSKDKSKKLNCRLLQFLFGALWVYIINVIQNLRFSESMFIFLKNVSDKRVLISKRLYSSTSK